MGFVVKTQIGETQHSVGTSLYGTCTTDKDTAEKVVTMPDFDALIAGTTIHVKFTNTNNAANPTLNVNGTGPLAIYRHGVTTPGTSKISTWAAGAVISFTFDGSYWMMEEPFDLTQMVNLIYPVGSIYMSVNSTSPATLFGGTWEQIKGKFLVAAGADGFNAGTAGGQKTISYTPAGTVGNTTLTTTQIPEHTHTFTGSSATTSSAGGSHTHTGPSHTHGMNSHTHSIPALSGTAASNGAHTHGVGAGTNFVYAPPDGNTNKGLKVISGGDGWKAIAADSSNSFSISTATGSAGAHTHTVSTTASTTGAASGSTAAAGTGATGSTSIAHTHTLTATGSNANTGGGGAHNHGFTGTAATLTTLPPYLPIYVWKRTA